MDNVLKIADSYLSVLHTNAYVAGAVTLFLVLYGAMAAPALPPMIAMLFENPVFKMLILVLVLIIRNYNPTMAVLIAIGFVISMQTLSKYRIFTMANELSGIATAPIKAMGDLVSTISDIVSTGNDAHEASNPGAEQFAGQEAESESESSSEQITGYQGPNLATIGLSDSTL